MAGLRRKLPPLTALVAFEAAARLRSFTRAADELGVTQAAVSRQIHMLEESLGYPVFHRLHRRIELTEKGRTLASATSTSLNLIADTVTELSATEGEGLTISATVAFSHFWLLPRISEFSRQHPEMKLQLVAQDDQREADREGVDLTIRFGNGMWPGGKADFLFRDEIFPVCSADYARDNPGIDSIAQVIAHPLIIHQSNDPGWTNWEGWLAAFGTALPPRGQRLVCSSYLDSVYAALSGQGIALGWGRLISDLIAQGRLVRLTPHATVTTDAYYLVAPHRSRKPALTAEFRDWLLGITSA